MKCIYCREVKPDSHFSGREHVMPQSFGTFNERNFTLHHKVCDDCNKYFANNLDIFLARDTHEGLLRFSHGVQEPSAYKHMGRRASLSVFPLEGQFKNARGHLEYDPKVGGLRVVLLPQIGFKLRDKDEYEFFLVEDFPSAQNFDYSRYDLYNESSFLSILLDNETTSRLLSSLKLNFRPFKLVEERNDGREKREIAVEYELTEPICRCLAKISFNYLANWNSTEIMLSSCFDRVRCYIRKGEGAREFFLVPREEPILGDEPVVGWRRDGHIITVFSVPDKQLLIGLVSLFNQMSYWVLLSHSSVIPPNACLEKGHLFSVSSREVIELRPGQTRFLQESP